MPRSPGRARGRSRRTRSRAPRRRPRSSSRDCERAVRPAGRPPPPRSRRPDVRMPRLDAAVDDAHPRAGGPSSRPRPTRGSTRSGQSLARAMASASSRARLHAGSGCTAPVTAPSYGLAGGTNLRSLRRRCGRRSDMFAICARSHDYSGARGAAAVRRRGSGRADSSGATDRARAPALEEFGDCDRPPRTSSSERVPAPAHSNELRTRASAGLVLAYSGQARYEDAERLAAAGARPRRERRCRRTASRWRGCWWMPAAWPPTLEQLESGGGDARVGRRDRARRAGSEAMRDEVLTAALGELGTLRWMQGRYAQGEAGAARSSSRLAERAFGPDAIETADGPQPAGDALQVLRQLRRGARALPPLSSRSSSGRSVRTPIWLASLHHNLGGLRACAPRLRARPSRTPAARSRSARSALGAGPRRRTAIDKRGARGPARRARTGSTRPKTLLRDSDPGASSAYLGPRAPRGRRLRQQPGGHPPDVAASSRKPRRSTVVRSRSRKRRSSGDAPPLAGPRSTTSRWY